MSVKGLAPTRERQRDDELNSLVRLTIDNCCSDLSKSTRVSKNSDFGIFTRETKYKGNPLKTSENEFAVCFDRVRRARSRGANITSNEGQGLLMTCLSGCSVHYTVSTDVREYFLCISNGCKITCFFTRASKTRLITTLPMHFLFSFIVCFASGLSRG